MDIDNRKTAVQLCHGYKMPFFDVAQQYSHTLKDSGYRVITIFLTGPYVDSIAEESFSDETLFFELTSNQLQGLKIGLLQKFNRICAKENVELIIAHRAKAIYLSCISAPFRRKVMIIGVAHAYDVFKRRSRKFLAYASQKQLRLVGVSNAIRDNIREALPAFPKENIQTFYNRFDFDEAISRLLSRKEAREKLGIEQDEYALVNIGRLHPDKDQRTLISAYANAYMELSQGGKCGLYIIGGGGLEESLRQQINDLCAGGYISLMGVVPDAWMYLRAFDSFVLSSDHEPFGMVLLEAIAAGLPVISTNCGGAAEINKSSFTFDVGGTALLSSLLVKLRMLEQREVGELVEKNLAYARKEFSFSMAQSDFTCLLASFNT